MSERTYSNLIDDLDWDFFWEAFLTFDGADGADGFGMYCAGHEL